jgi:hypothetical protein
MSYVTPVLRAASFAIAVAASTGCPPAAAPPAPAVPKPPPEFVPACVAPSDRATPIVGPVVDGTRVAFCIGTSTSCFAVDVERGRLEALREPPKPSPRARVDVVQPQLAVCADGASCTAMTSKILPAASQLRAATDPAGKLMAVLLGDAARGRGYAELWNVEQGRRLALFRYGAGTFRCGEDIALLDDKAIYISASQCGQPAARATLYRLNGTRLASVGGRDFGSYGHRYVHVEGNRWAFLEENASAVVIHDVETGALVRKVDVTPLFRFSGAEMSNPGESAIVRLGDGRLVIVAGAPAVGTLGVIDGATGALTIMPATQCGAAPPAVTPAATPAAIR